MANFEKNVIMSDKLIIPDEWYTKSTIMMKKQHKKTD